jgi:NAD(P)H-dependent FMN reductase/ketosteroid isomerase-like protein
VSSTPERRTASEEKRTMSRRFVVAVLVGSLRKGSISRRVASALLRTAPASLECRIVEIGDLPLYNEDLEGDVPGPWSRFRAEVAAAQAVLFVTPEYNRSIPGGLKNAIDVGSRPSGQSVFEGRPAGIVSVTPYKLGAFGANHALRQALVFMNMPALQQPEVYLGGAGDLFEDDGRAKNDETRALLAKFMAEFADWCAMCAESADASDFEDFMKRREAAAHAYVRGDASMLDALVTRNGPATFFHPRGDVVQGAEAVAKRYDADAKSFDPSGQSTLEILQSGAGGDVAFFTGFQTAEAKIRGKPVSMRLRITEVFRRIAGEWRLVHRHADAEGPAKE